MDGGTQIGIGPFWHALGIAGAVIFYGRFYVQWLASERAGRSVMPILFWYMSSIGSVLLMIFAVTTQSPVGALSQSFNLVVYSRNLVHIWRERGTLTPLRYRAAHGISFAVALTAIVLLVYVWGNEYKHVSAAPPHVSRAVWFWLAIGVAGQALFAARFLVQWLATEKRRQSVVPPAFWYLSLVASLLQAASFLQRREWIFAAGLAATLLIYLRNIWFVRKQDTQVSTGGSVS